MQTVGIGMIGSGFMGLTYSEVVSRHAQGCKLIAIAGGKRANQLAEEYSVSAETGAAPAEIALAWLMAKPAVTAPIASATSLAQLASLTKAAALTLSADQMAALDRAGA